LTNITIANKKGVLTKETRNILTHQKAPKAQKQLQLLTGQSIHVSSSVNKGFTGLPLPTTKKILEETQAAFRYPAFISTG
jgi:hypothetical protein